MRLVIDSEVEPELFRQVLTTFDNFRQLQDNSLTTPESEPLVLQCPPIAPGELRVIHRRKNKTQTRWTAERHKNFLQYIVDGVPVEKACALLGVTLRAGQKHFNDAAKRGEVKGYICTSGSTFYYKP